MGARGADQQLEKPEEFPWCNPGGDCSHHHVSAIDDKPLKPLIYSPSSCAFFDPPHLPPPQEAYYNNSSTPPSWDSGGFLYTWVRFVRTLAGCYAALGPPGTFAHLAVRGSGTNALGRARGGGPVRPSGWPPCARGVPRLDERQGCLRSWRDRWGAHGREPAAQPSGGPPSGRHPGWIARCTFGCGIPTWAANSVIPMARMTLARACCTVMPSSLAAKRKARANAPLRSRFARSSFQSSRRRAVLALRLVTPIPVRAPNVLMIAAPSSCALYSFSILRGFPRPATRWPGRGAQRLLPLRPGS